jgi:uncharacterized protein (DUF488 family)
MQETLFTIGHSTHTQDRLIALLQKNGVTAVYDVRSKPYSRRNPQFNREQFKRYLLTAGISYVFLGEELGARSEDPSCYEEGRVQYDRLAQAEVFRKGLDRIEAGMKEYRLVLMCAEKEPLQCHIHADGTVESHDEALSRLLRQFHLPERDMFRSHKDMLEDAYRIQEKRIAYKRELVRELKGPTMRIAG